MCRKILVAVMLIAFSVNAGSADDRMRLRYRWQLQHQYTYSYKWSERGDESAEIKLRYIVVDANGERAILACTSDASEIMTYISLNARGSVQDTRYLIPTDMTFTRENENAAMAAIYAQVHYNEELMRLPSASMLGDGTFDSRTGGSHWSMTKRGKEAVLMEHAVDNLGNDTGLRIRRCFDMESGIMREIRMNIDDEEGGAVLQLVAKSLIEEVLYERIRSGYEMALDSDQFAEVAFLPYIDSSNNMLRRTAYQRMIRVLDHERMAVLWGKLLQSSANARNRHGDYYGMVRPWFYAAISVGRKPALRVILNHGLEGLADSLGDGQIVADINRMLKSLMGIEEDKLEAHFAEWFYRIENVLPDMGASSRESLLKTVSHSDSMIRLFCIKRLASMPEVDTEARAAVIRAKTDECAAVRTAAGDILAAWEKANKSVIIRRE